ncbi:putative lipoprotein [Tatumella ptyseos ATCC 33301]|uniref:Probable endopeptidase Spr n=2 Tax=Tatumella ptyseos TaxID=82987 RepID=A0A2X5NM74_9GAMM|nr:NlpC/P60 family protein [Tatumella ptyseos]KFD18627.1 putative lipoprotein [Tatumella ptyseos ATCC 33301]SQK74668.1 Probable endopeptidase Spr precursor [Tatumella ptyseos]
MVRIVIVFLIMLLAGCSSHAPAPNANLSDPAVVRAVLNEQLSQWRGTPYRFGGLSRRGVDCSGFVYLTFRDRFDIRLPRTTRGQSDIGTRIRKSDLMPGDLVFFKTGWGGDGLHVGIYDKNNQFIHASTSRGVMRSSLNNVYWRKVFWQARRI